MVGTHRLFYLVHHLYSSRIMILNRIICAVGNCREMEEDTMAVIDLNCDMGESYGAYTIGNDEAMLDTVTSANVACGFHGGDPMVMHATLLTAKEKGVAVGAHPSFMDFFGFGRRQILNQDPEDLEKQIIYQMGAIEVMARTIDHPITHMKTHGALGNMACVDRALSRAVVNATLAVNPELGFVVLPNSETEKVAKETGLRLIREAFADRTYDDSGMLTPRNQSDAIIHDPAHAAERALRMIEYQEITTTTGKRIPTQIDTICVHGDNSSAVDMARRLRETFERNGIEIRSSVT